MMRAIITTAVLGLALVEASVPSHAQEWRAIEGQCVKQIGEQRGHWPAWALCTIDRAFPGTDPAWVRQCIQREEQIRDREHACNLCGDPVRAVVSCSQERRS
jgi:hypothetical protein